MTIPIVANRWRAATKAVLERISDEHYQRLAWFNRHEEVSSPDELINQLLDDFSFECFIENEEIALTASQRSVARQFHATLLAFNKASPNLLDPTATIDDPKWVEIRAKAKELLGLLFP
jgi:hypothetical protein